MINTIAVDRYNDDIYNKLEKDDTAENQSENDLNAPEDSAKAESCTFRSSMSTVVINSIEDSANWPVNIIKNVRE